ncbi:hypothetical protein Syun_025499 [Stephania yunnanensis]|uniref:Uncharacterized protein n=1 Tax=Stephania yunnanensis TaxID=152371 RepID=A0AAP0F0N8_9MAGN
MEGSRTDGAAVVDSRRRRRSSRRTAQATRTDRRDNEPVRGSSFGEPPMWTASSGGDTDQQTMAVARTASRQRVVERPAAVAR